MAGAAGQQTGSTLNRPYGICINGHKSCFAIFPPCLYDGCTFCQTVVKMKSRTLPKCHFDATPWPGMPMPGHGLILGLGLVLTCAVPALADPVQLQAATGTDSQQLLSELRGQLPDEAKPDTVFQARQQAKRAARTVKELLNARGYYAPQLTPAVHTENPIRPYLIVDPGQQFRIGTLDIDYQGEPPRSDDARAVQSGFSLKPGDIAIPARVIAQQSAIITDLQQRGYAFAETQGRSARGHRDTALVDVTYDVSAGRRTRFGTVEFPPDSPVKAKYLHKLVPFETGDLYNPDDLDKFRSRLNGTGLFSVSTASMQPGTPDGKADHDATSDVLVHLQMRKHYTLKLGASLSTDQGPGATAELTRRNFTHNGDFLVASANANKYQQALGLQWQRPNQFGYGRNLVLGTGISNENTDAYDRQSLSVNGGLDVRTDNKINYGFGAEASLVRESGAQSAHDLVQGNVYGYAGIDRTDSILNPTRGWRVQTRVAPSMTFDGVTAGYVRSTAEASGYLPLDSQRKFVLAGRVKGGSVWGAALDDLPASSRFYAGGGGSVRGFAYQAIGPLQPGTNTPTGGRSLLLASASARWHFRQKWGLAAFADAGTVGSDAVPELSDMRAGAGVGVRYYTPAGPLRLDFAVPIDPRADDAAFQVYISLGQAF